MVKAEEFVTAAVTSAEGSDSEAEVRLKNLQKERGKAVQNLEGGAARLALHRAKIAANEHAMEPFLGSGEGEYQQMEDCVSKIANQSELKIGDIAETMACSEFPCGIRIKKQIRGRLRHQFFYFERAPTSRPSQRASTKSDPGCDASNFVSGMCEFGDRASRRFEIADFFEVTVN